MKRFDRRRLRHIRDIVRQGPTETGYAYFRARRRKRNLADDEPELLESRSGRARGRPRRRAGRARRQRRARARLPRVGALRRALDPVVRAGVLERARRAGSTRSCASPTTRGGSTASRAASRSPTRRDPATAAAVAGRIGAAFPGAGGRAGAARRQHGAAVRTLAFATSWTSIYALARLDRARAKLVFVQDWEADFQPAGSAPALTGARRRGIRLPGRRQHPGAGRRLARRRQRRGLVRARGRHRALPPARSARGRTAPVRVFFYGRPWNSRNAFGLGLRSRCGS